MSILSLVFLFTIKHYLADFQFQTSYMYLNKGTWMHPGGLIHSGLHGLMTMLILYFVDISIIEIICFAILDFGCHYIIDYFKINITKKYGWAKYDKDSSGKGALCIYDNKFFIALGIDQMMHWLTYCLILALIVWI